ncbi:MAG: hypothetical protein ACREFE_14985, partial [Limisphaerales bacterium]
MPVRTGNIFLIIALLAAMSAHWTLQSVAWTTMLADNLHHGSFAQAITRTFDGKHPCCLCKAIAAEKKSAPKNEFAAQSQKFEFPPAAENFVFVAPEQFQLLRPANFFADSFAQKPPTP